MPAKDVYHDVVKEALIKAGWTITHDPLVLWWGTVDVYVDLGAEKLLAAEKGADKIAVPEEIYQSIFEEAIGKLLLENHRVKLVVFDRIQEVILRWIP
jgi:hypothetical protein